MADARDPEVQRLLDREAIVDCLHRYSRGLDRHDREILASVYHEDAIDNHGDFIDTRDVFVPWADELLASEWNNHTHMLDVNYVDIDGDVAHTECYVLFVQQRKDGPVLDMGGGRYIDRLERRNGEWRVVARQLVIDWQGRTETAEFGGGENYRLGRWNHSDPSYRRPFELELPSKAT